MSLPICTVCIFQMVVGRSLLHTSFVFAIICYTRSNMNMTTKFNQLSADYMLWPQIQQHKGEVMYLINFQFRFYNHLFSLSRKTQILLRTILIKAIPNFSWSINEFFLLFHSIYTEVIKRARLRDVTNQKPTRPCVIQLRN